MMRKKVERSKTQKKQSRSALPSLKMPSRLITMESFFAPTQARKYSENLNKKQSVKREKFQLKRFVDENIYQMITGKNSAKFSRKKIYNQLITIQQIGPSTLLAKSAASTNILDYATDQYQGLRDYNEDRILTNLNVKILDKIYHFFGVFDGHGGSFVSEYLKNNFVKIFEEQMKESPMLNVTENLRKTIFKIQSKLNDLYKSKQFCGGSCASVIIFHESSYYIVHLGDSRILHVSSNDQKFQFQQLTTDHKPDQKNQKTRIQSMGGKIYRNKINVNNDSGQNFGPYRVIPGKLSVSRTIADFQVKNLPCGHAITCEPQILEGKVEQTSLFLIFSDGAYQRFENSDIVEYFSKKKKIQEIQMRKSIQSFLINSILKESSDNISMISLIVKGKKIAFE